MNTKRPNVLVLSQGGNFLKPALAAIGADAGAGTTGVLKVRHDATCALLARRGPCDCEPSVSWHACADAAEALALVRGLERKGAQQ